MPRLTVPISFKLWVGVTLSVAVASTILFYELSGRERQRLVDAKVQASLMVTELLASSLVAPIDFEDEDATREALGHATKSANVLWAGAFAAGTDRLIASSGDANDGAPSLPSRIEGPQVGADAVVVTKKVRGKTGQEIGTAVLVLTLAPENRAFVESRASILRLCILLGLGTATLIVLVTHLQLVRPLMRVVEAARGLTKKRARVRVEVRSRDEVGLLARAFNEMSDAVVDREHELEQARGRIEELLDNMRQGIVVIGRDGRIVGPQSRAAAELFGRTDFDQVSIVDLLFGDAEAWHAERHAFEAWLELATEVSREDWPSVAELSPKEAVLGAGDAARVLDLELRTLGDGRIMLLAADVTDARKLTREVAQKSQEAAGLRRALGGAHVFARFLDSARERVRTAQQIAAGAELSAADRNDLLRQVHTLKGEAHMYELSDAVGAAREIEHFVASLAADAGGFQAELSAMLGRLSQALDAAEARFVELAGPDALRRVPVDRDALDKLLACTAGQAGETPRLVRALAARPFGEIVATLAERVPVWAAQSGKDAELVVSGEAVPIANDVWNPLSGAIVHLVRNAIAHGIEAREKRIELGKAERGVVRVTGTLDANGAPRIEISDDGAGIAATDLARIFEPGFTTRAGEGDLAGRGVGLYAVREELRRIRYDIVLTEAPTGATFILQRAAEAQA